MNVSTPAPSPAALDDAARDWVGRFLFHLAKIRRLSPHTEFNYRHDLRLFVAYCDRNDIRNWQQVDGQHVRMFAAAEHRRGQSARTIQRRLSAVRSFFEYLIGERQVHANPAIDIRAPKGKKKLPKTLDADLMAKLLDFRTDDELSVRDKAIMELFYSSGLRLAELVGADVEHLDLMDRAIRVKGKGSKERVVPVGRCASEALTAWLKERAAVAQPDERALFVTRLGTRMSTDAVWKRVRGWALKQGIGVNMHPHMFRHSFASHILESSHDLRAVQELLGHANIATTQIYTHLDFQHLARIYDQAHPRAKRKL